jgi:5-methylcytosine-specific restriction protein A
MPQAAMHVCSGAGCRKAIPHGERYCPGCRAEYDRNDRARRGSARERGYDARWERYRAAYLCRHPLCVECAAAGRVRAASVVDHVRDHKGDTALFWDPANHRALCKPCHDRRVDAGDFGRPATPALRVGVAGAGVTLDPSVMPHPVSQVPGITSDPLGGVASLGGSPPGPASPSDEKNGESPKQGVPPGTSGGRP